MGELSPRVSDGDRERAVHALREHLVEGRLTLEEFAQRVEVTLRAGTLDEVFETAVLVQTGKIRDFPIILMGADYWGPMFDFFRTRMLEEKTISPADADLLIKLAEAKKTQLRNDAFQGAGSDRMVGLKMAEVYRGLQLLVLPSDGAGGVNPLNLEQAMKLLEVRKESRP